MESNLNPAPATQSRLIQASFLMLFTELVLIRWTGSNVIYLSYFSNLILLGSFLGIGIGFMRSHSARTLFYLSPFLLTAFVAFIYKFPFHVNRLGSDLIFFGDYSASATLPAWFFLPLIFMGVTAVMASVADGVAQTFRQFPPLQAYRLEILGSLLGILTFSVCAWLNAPPLCWGLIIAGAFSLLLLQNWRTRDPLTILQIASLIMLAVLFARETFTPGTFWSPYYKIGVSSQGQGRFSFTTNEIPHQAIIPTAQRQLETDFYFVPYRYMPHHFVLHDVLIVGAGTGSDVAIALQKGARRIDAVEIDPMLFNLGRQLNPDKPYDNPRVHVHINDGRAFLQNTHRHYDMIIFALPDSLTLISGQSSLRLENYLFTTEAIMTMQQHLKPGGIFTMYNYYRERWLLDRFARTLQTVFHHRPCMDTWGSDRHWLSVLTIRQSETPLHCHAAPASPDTQASTPSTDNHPFIYLKGSQIPYSYVLMLVFILVASVGSLSAMGGSLRSVQSHADFFFMGAAFLLLESKSIVCFALLFGTTWFVNALVFTGVLLSVYLSLETAIRIPLQNRSLLYAGLYLALFLAWLIPDSALLSFSAPVRFLAAVVLAFSPIFFGNLIFAERFQHTPDPAQSFGANLVGAMVGGLTEYASLVTGYHALLILAGVFYALAIIATVRVSAHQEALATLP